VAKARARRPEVGIDLRHLRRETRTALELAVVTLAPSDLVDRLAIAAGLLEALVELPADCAPAAAVLPKTVTRAKSALDEWNQWHEKHLQRRIPRV
jgi:hypothetical protein